MRLVDDTAFAPEDRNQSGVGEFMQINGTGEFMQIGWVITDRSPFNVRL
jgi:hypothetical protein